MAHANRMLHSRFNRIMAILVWAGAGLVAAFGLWGSEPSLVWVYPAAGLAAFLAWAALWRPGVGVDAAGVHVQNVTHSVDIPWEALIHLDTKHALTLLTPGRRFTVWSAPAPGMMTSQIISRRPLNREAKAVGNTPRTGDLLGSDSGDAAMLVRDAWQRRLDAGLVTVGVADELVVTRRWDTTVAVVSALLLTATLWALAATG
ncbi:MAG TPA: PH domain-containing protein [Microbacterium sp.]|uniref:PH domain-containing protein n=1 Tax=Microbacterium sp. TaxID=51671 RepID=UPI002BA06E7C|nr:PH domain-containing protein [Microbacterium sp.]HWI32570.1 PH domain-containing protein [Microbacterium sp.]